MSAHAAALVSSAVLVLACLPAAAQSAPQKFEADRTAVDAALMRQVSKCWTPPPIEALPFPLVQVEFGLTRKGALLGAPKVNERGSKGLTPVHADAAIRAIRACAPYKLPARFYDYWRLVRVNFALTPPPASPSPQ